MYNRNLVIYDWCIYYYTLLYRPVVFSFGSPQEYSADFVMATLATTTGDITTDHQHAARPSAAAASTTKPRVSNNRWPTTSVSKQKLATNHSDIVTTPPPAVSIAETPNKDGNPVSWLEERTIVNETSDHHNDEHVSSSRPVEDEEFITQLQHDAETDNLLDSLFDDIINDDIGDNVYSFTQHPHTTTGKYFKSSNTE